MTKNKIRVPKAQLDYWGKMFDEQSIRVYTAAHYGKAVHEAYFKTKVEVRDFINQVRKSKIWKTTWGKEAPIISFYSKSQRKWAWGGYKFVKGKLRPFIKLPNNPFGRSITVLLHELAHCIVLEAGHGCKFCYAYLALTAEFQGTAFAEALEQRFYDTGALRRRKK